MGKEKTTTTSATSKTSEKTRNAVESQEMETETSPPTQNTENTQNTQEPLISQDIALNTQSSTPESQRILCGQPDPVVIASQLPEVEVPDALQQLLDSGIRFHDVEPEIWNISGYSASLNKSLSVAFHLEVPATMQDIADGFADAHIDVKTIFAIQRKNSNQSWIVTFTSPEAKTTAENTRVFIFGNEITFGTTDNRTTIVKIFESPNEMPDTAIIGRLTCYGRVLSFRREKEGNFYNGVRSARMRLRGPVPSTIFIAGEMVRAWHPDQPKTCRRCGADDHLASECRSTRCWNCEKSGHRADNCPSKPLCGICLDERHPLSLCPFLVHCANVADVRVGETTYARVAAAAVGEGGAGAPDPPAPIQHRKRDRIAENKAKHEQEKQERRERRQKEREQIEFEDKLEEERLQRERDERHKRRTKEFRRSQRLDGSSDDGERLLSRGGRERERDEPRQTSHQDHVRDRSARPVRTLSDDERDGWEVVSYRRRKKT